MRTKNRGRKWCKRKEEERNYEKENRDSRKAKT